jgi:hypothetical protein
MAIFYLIYDIVYLIELHEQQHFSHVIEPSIVLRRTSFFQMSSFTPPPSPWSRSYTYQAYLLFYKYMAVFHLTI